MLDSVTVAPPDGAATLRPTEQFEVPLPLRLVGLQDTDDTEGTAITPEVPADTDNAVAFAVTPMGFAIAIVVVVALDARVT